jgi:hypothetical protein
LAHAAVLGARAAGVEVTEEPELPERAVSVSAPDIHGWRVGADGDSLYQPILSVQPYQATNSWEVAERFLAGLVRRYNARVTVLALAEELDTPENRMWDSRDVARRLRRAYEDPAP